MQMQDFCFFCAFLDHFLYIRDIPRATGQGLIHRQINLAQQQNHPSFILFQIHQLQLENRTLCRDQKSARCMVIIIICKDKVWSDVTFFFFCAIFNCVIMFGSTCIGVVCTNLVLTGTEITKLKPGQTVYR